MTGGEGNYFTNNINFQGSVVDNKRKCIRLVIMYACDTSISFSTVLSNSLSVVSFIEKFLRVYYEDDMKKRKF